MSVKTGADEVLAANIAVHRIEAPYYDVLHPEETNFYERSRRRRAFAFVQRLLTEGVSRPVALDLGCGTGKVSLSLWRRGFDVFSVDLSFDMLVQFRRRLVASVSSQRSGSACPPPRLICADLFSFLSGCQARFDLIVFCGTLHHLADVRTAARLAASRLGPAGILLITHEPLKQPITSRARYAVHRALGRLDEALFRLRISSLPQQATRIDYAAADFQRRFGGIDPYEVVEVLKQAGLVIVDLRKYCVRRFGLFSLICNALLGSENTFQIIASRPGP